MKSNKIQDSSNLELNHLIGDSVNNALLRRNGALSNISDEAAAQIAGGTIAVIHGVIINPNPPIVPPPRRHIHRFPHRP